MEIHGHFPGKAMPNDVSSTRQPVKSDKAHGAIHPHIHGSGDLQQTTSLSRLTADLRQIPEVREDVISRVQQNLNSGEYFSKEAAQATAAAIFKGQ